jgi:hypothetical protein
VYLLGLIGVTFFGGLFFVLFVACVLSGCCYFLVFEFL